MEKYFISKNFIIIHSIFACFLAPPLLVISFFLEIIAALILVTSHEPTYWLLLISTLDTTLSHGLVVSFNLFFSEFLSSSICLFIFLVLSIYFFLSAYQFNTSYLPFYLRCSFKCYSSYSLKYSYCFICC